MEKKVCYNFFEVISVNRQKNNICKFVPLTNPRELTTLSFVYETNVNSTPKTLVNRNHTLGIVVSGKGRLYTDYQKNDIEAGTLFFMFEGSSYKIENADSLNFIFITFKGQRADELFNRFGISPANYIFKGYEGLVSFWQSSIVKANENNLDLISEGVLMYTFSQLYCTNQTKEDYLINDILKFIEANFTDPDLSLQSAASELGYNAKYISRIFKESLGVTFSEYLKNIRIQHASFLIEQGITAIKNVAILSGYNDPFYFSNVFKKTVGMSPSEYVKNKGDVSK